MKKRLLIYILCLILLLLSGCATLPGLFRSHKTPNVTPQMYREASSFNTDVNNTRLIKFLQRASHKEPLTIGFFGGSITEGYASSDPSNCYAQKVMTYFENTFPATKFTYINAGIAGTGSGIGVHRVHDDLLSQQPDLVIIDAAVNDNNNEHYKETYENLVRQILTCDSEPAVILLFMVEDSGNCATQVESEIGRAYKLPMINYGAAVSYGIEKGKFTWEDIAEDYVHPSDRGHSIISELITTYIEDTYDGVSNFLGQISDETVAKSAPAPDYSSMPYVTKKNYTNGHILDFSQIKASVEGNFIPYADNEAFPKGYTLRCEAENVPETGNAVSSSSDSADCLSFNVSAANIGLLLQSPELDKAGFFDVYIDNEPVSVFSYQGFLMCDVDVFSSQEVKEHTVTIKRNPDYQNAEITILAVLTSE